MTCLPKADIASIGSWWIGMSGVMATIGSPISRHAFGGAAEVDPPGFWFLMQAATIAGSYTAYPVNRLLIRGGVKEKM